jgi:glycine/D-amino acid oxidase-like deaminating enzyme
MAMYTLLIDAGPERNRSSPDHLRAAIACVPVGTDYRAASLLSPGHTGRAAAGRRGAAERGRLRGHRHSVWGILNAPATGEALAELIAEGVSSTTDLTPFDLARLRPLDPSLLRSG